MESPTRKSQLCTGLYPTNLRHVRKSFVSYSWNPFWQNLLTMNHNCAFCIMNVNEIKRERIIVPRVDHWHCYVSRVCLHCKFGVDMFYRENQVRLVVRQTTMTITMWTGIAIISRNGICGPFMWCNELELRTIIYIFMVNIFKTS